MRFNLTSFFLFNTGGAGGFDGNETLFSRDANISLIGNFGSISLGRELAPNILPSILFNPFDDSFKLSLLITDKGKVEGLVSYSRRHLRIDRECRTMERRIRLI